MLEAKTFSYTVQPVWSTDKVSTYLKYYSRSNDYILTIERDCRRSLCPSLYLPMHIMHVMCPSYNYGQAEDRSFGGKFMNHDAED